MQQVLINEAGTKNYAGPYPPGQPAPVPCTLTGRYYCNGHMPSSGSSRRTEVTLVYNAHTGNIIGLPANAARHSFGFNMGRRNVERSRNGIFYWYADIRNRNYFPALSSPLFLLRNGDLASAKVTRVPGTLGYEVAAEDIATMVVFSRTGIFTDPFTVAEEIGELASRVSAGGILETESRMYS